MNEIDDINGAMRAIDGTFWVLPHKRFRTDGRTQHLPREPLHTLVVRKAREQLARAEYEAVVVARSKRWAWRDVAEVLHLAVSTVHKRFAAPSPLD